MPRKKKKKEPVKVIPLTEIRALWEVDAKKGRCVHCNAQGPVKNYGIKMDNGLPRNRCFVCDNMWTLTLPGQMAFCTNLILEVLAELRRDIDLAVTSYERAARRAQK